MKRIALATLLAAATAIPAISQRSDSPPPPALVVTGNAQIMAVPDEATVRLGIVRQATSAQVAQEQEALRVALARFPAWVTEAERGTALAALDKSAVCAVEDERFLAELARMMGRPDLESQYKQILSLKKVQ